jgi:hypothetical protein
MKEKLKSIILLSEKSSGSSAFQNLLASVQEIKHVKSTRHFENETLFWTKAASILEMPQLKMVDSEVPISRKKAMKDLHQLLKANGVRYDGPPDTREKIMQGWLQLCVSHQPVFFEKSPHHLCQWSALELIMEAMEKNKQVDTMLVGLIRNPMDTIYSNYKRWKSYPGKVEKQWITAYHNLLKLKEKLEGKLYIIRYEDLISSVDYLAPVLKFCDIDPARVSDHYFHGKSLQKWKNDPFFGYVLGREASDLAKQFGYADEELVNMPHYLWPVAWGVNRLAHQLVAPVKMLVKS